MRHAGQNDPHFTTSFSTSRPVYNDPCSISWPIAGTRSYRKLHLAVPIQSTVHFLCLPIHSEAGPDRQCLPFSQALAGDVRLFKYVVCYFLTELPILRIIRSYAIHNRSERLRSKPFGTVHRIVSNRQPNDLHLLSAQALNICIATHTCTFISLPFNDKTIPITW